MKKPAFFFAVLCTSLSLYGQTFEYKPFFTVRVIDNEDSEYLFSDMRYLNSDNELKYFFWIRRGSDLGTATYQLDFKKIKNIEFNGEYDNPIPDYTPSKITLTSGEVFDVLVNTSGTVGGMDSDFGVFGKIYMNYNIIKSIEFIHDGEYKKCPFCSALFYNSEKTVCPFDRTELINQHNN